MKIYLIILICLLVTCKQSEKNIEPLANSVEKKVEKEHKSIQKTVDRIIYNQDKITITDSIPFGKRELIEIDFPSIWKLSSDNIYQKQFDSIYFHLQKFFDSYKSKTRYLNPVFDSLEVKLKKKIQKDGHIIAKFPNHMKTEIFLYTGGDNNQTNIWGDLLIINNGKINRLNIYEYYETGYTSKQKLFYFDNNFDIYVKEFSGDEEENSLLSDKKFVI